MSPNVYDIIRVSLNIAKNIFFYLPRNLDLFEFLDILSSIKNEIEKTESCELFLNIRILKSNKKIKALLIIFGRECHELIQREDLDDYFHKNYDNATTENLNYIETIIKVIGYFNFFKLEMNFQNSKYKSLNINLMFKNIFDFISAENKEKIKILALNAFKEHHPMNKFYQTKNYYSNGYTSSNYSNGLVNGQSIYTIGNNHSSYSQIYSYPQKFYYNLNSYFNNGNYFKYNNSGNNLNYRSNSFRTYGNNYILSNGAFHSNSIYTNDNTSNRSHSQSHSEYNMASNY